MANNTNNITKTVASLINILTPRNKDIVSRRFGLKSGKKETLESIGHSYGITRERVRQIEDFSLKQLSKNFADNSELAKYSSIAKDLLSENGGIMKESELFKAFSGNEKESPINSSLVFLLILAKEPVRCNENDGYHSFWAPDEQYTDSFIGSVSAISKSFEKTKIPIPREDFLIFAQKSGAVGFDSAGISNKHINAYLTVSKELGMNVFNEVGLISWSEVRPKGVRDKAYLVLKKENNPKHFSEIAKLINTTSFSAKKANVQTVHNELIKDQRFVLVGRGMYGLSEWGYKSGTVKDVLVDILKSSSKSLPKTELVAKVMDMRMVKENTILLNLQDSKVFAKKDDGTYALKKV